MRSRGTRGNGSSVSAGDRSAAGSRRARPEASPLAKAAREVQDHPATRTLWLDEHRGAELDLLVHRDDVRVRHANAAVAHGLAQDLGLLGSVKADRPSVV